MFFKTADLHRMEVNDVLYRCIAFTGLDDHGSIEEGQKYLFSHTTTQPTQ
jgi:hypothetical protein